MNHDTVMHRVIELSRQGAVAGHGGPFGAVVVRDGAQIAEAHNEVLSSCDPTAHAEILAVRRASAKLGTFDLSGCDLYTIGAPCCMCMASMLWARIRRVYYILPLSASAAIGLGDEHFYAEVARPPAERQIIPMICEAALAEHARDVYRLWHQMAGRVAF